MRRFLKRRVCFTFLFSFVFQGIDPISKICECPLNANNFSNNSEFYTGCVNQTSEWYLKYNNVSENKTFQISGI